MALAGQVELGSCKFSAGGIFQCRQKNVPRRRNTLYFSLITWIVCRYFGLEKCNFCLRHEKWLFWKFFPGVNYELVSQNKKCCAGGSTSSCSRCPSDPPHCTGGEHRSFEVFTWSLVFRYNCVTTVFLCRRFHTSILTSSLTCSRWTNQLLPNPIQLQMMIIMFDEFFFIAKMIINNTTTLCATTTTLHNIIPTTTMTTMKIITTTPLTMVIQAESLSLGERNYSRLVGPNGPLVKYFVLVAGGKYHLMM